MENSGSWDFCELLNYLSCPHFVLHGLKALRVETPEPSQDLENWFLRVTYREVSLGPYLDFRHQHVERSLEQPDSKKKTGSPLFIREPLSSGGLSFTVDYKSRC